MHLYPTLVCTKALHRVPMPMGFGWAWVGMGGHRFVHPCIRLQIRVKFLGCKEYSNQEALQTEGNDNERPFICPIQPRLGVGGWYTLHNFWIHGRNLNSMGGHMSCYGWAWVGIGRCWWSWSGYGYKFEGKCWALVCTSSLIPLINEKRHQILKATWCCEYPEERRKPRDLLARWSRLRGVPNSAVYNQFLRFVVVQNLLGFMLQGIQGSWLWGFSVTFFQGSWNQARAVIRVRISDSAIAMLSHPSALWSRGSCAHRLSDWVMRSKQQVLLYPIHSWTSSRKWTSRWGRGGWVNDAQILYTYISFT